MSTHSFSPEHEVIGLHVEHLKTVDSTNTYLDRQATLGAPHGLVVIADEQTVGRGRFGRSFQSPNGKGLYLSLLLRPKLPAAQLAVLTPWVAVAVCRTVESLTGLRPGIKWINDIVLDGKKLCGILTEAHIAPDGRLNHMIVGIGLNIAREAGEFTPEVAAIATSLAEHLSHPPSRDQLAAALLRELDRMWADFPARKEEYLAFYRSRCITPGEKVSVISPRGTRPGFAREIDENFALVVEFSDGTVENIESGEVSVLPTD